MNYTILVADDEKEIRELLRLYLENAQYRVEELGVTYSGLQLTYAGLVFGLPKGDYQSLVLHINKV